jgi:uncharacterized protein YlaI
MKAIRVGAVDWLYSVYVIGPGDGPYKIGLARNPENRLSSLQTGHHQDLFIHWTFGMLKKAEAQFIERAAHSSLKDKRVRGEWFACSVKEAIDAISQHIDSRVQTSRYLATKDLRGYMTPENMYRIALKAQEGLTNGNRV